MSYDFTIVGGGPCGSTLAKRLASKFKVLLLERRDLSRPYEKGMFTKCCGGLFSENAQRMLAAMGYAVPNEILAEPQVFSVRVIDLQTKAENHYPKHYINIDRERFDRWLAGLIPADTTCIYGALFKKFEPESGTVVYTKNGIEYSVKTRYLIGADGGNSSVRAQWRPFRNEVRYITIQEFYETETPLASHVAFFDPRITDYYGWAIPKDGETLFGVALKPGTNAQAKFERMRDSLAEFGFKFGKPTRREGAYIVRPSRFRDIYCGEEKVFLAGEAAGMISPSSSEGYSYAFQSAEILAGYLLTHENPDPKEYRDTCSNIFMRLLAATLRSPAMFTPWIRNLAIQSGLGALRMKD